MTGVIAVVMDVIVFTIANESAIPMAHHATVRRTDSTRNCSMISLLFAPIALRIPISLVLSDTVTRRIFITQIPHTRSDIAAIPQRNIFIVAVMLESVSRASSWLVTVNVALLASVISNTSRSLAVIDSLVVVMFSSSSTMTEMLERYLVHMRDICAVVIGI
jgi:hypothetical protein